jgi:hypothetical protein
VANNLVVNPIRPDSVMLTSWKTQIAASLGSFQNLRVEKIVWETPVTVGDQIIFEDNLANVLATLQCDTANVSQALDWTPKPRRWADFTLTKISSGVVWLYLA